MSKEALSPRETEVLAMAWFCMDTEPKIDFDKLATLAGYSSRASASVTFGNIKRKLKGHINSGPGSTPSGTPKKAAATPKKPATPKTPKSGKRAVPDPTDPANETPSKKRSTKKPATNHQDDDDEEFKEMRVKKEETSDLLQSATEFYNQTRVYPDTGYGAYAGYTTYDENPNTI